ncbi:MAG: nitrogen fixation protein NifX [Alphaproteobacteria bacterium]|nr:nitrogen fixation protein NifX [Alphaproteobacteria bacterium]TAD88256.1 MAG: nitrogen fixation protein NifX [Alphaproteobacteria bacterium]
MALRRLQLVDTEAPSSEPLAGALTIAFATTDLKTVNAHFGGTKTFSVWEISPTASRFVEALQFDSHSDQSGKHDDSEDKITPKVDGLKGCALLFCAAIGGPAAAKVVAAGIHPVKLPNPEPIEAVIQRVQAMLGGSPPPWLRKAMRQASGTGFVAEEE